MCAREKKLYMHVYAALFFSSFFATVYVTRIYTLSGKPTLNIDRALLQMII